MKKAIFTFVITCLFAISFAGCSPLTTSYNVDEKFAICLNGYKAVETGVAYLSDVQMSSSALNFSQLSIPDNGLNWSGPDADGWYTTQVAGQTIRFRYRSGTNTYEYSQELTYENGGTIMSITNLFSGAKGSNNHWTGYTILTSSTVSGGENNLDTTKHLFSGVDQTYGCGTYDGWFSRSGTLFPPASEEHQYYHLVATYVSGSNMVHVVGTYWGQINYDASIKTDFNKTIYPRNASL